MRLSEITALLEKVKAHAATNGVVDPDITFWSVNADEPSEKLIPELPTDLDDIQVMGSDKSVLAIKMIEIKK